MHHYRQVLVLDPQHLVARTALRLLRTPGRRRC